MRLPGPKDRTLIVGRTGSGKSQAATWHLSQYDIDKMPWIVVNHKGDELIDSIPGAQFIDLDHKLDSKMKPGVYILHPSEKDNDQLDAFMWRMHRRGNIGIYSDEGYMMPDKSPYWAFNALITQGRSLRIPMITLTQRPVFITRFARSESTFYRIFHLNDKDDRKTINAFIPGVDLDYLMAAPPNQEPRLPNYHSVYRDVAKNTVAIAAPAPIEAIILQNFQLKLNTHKRKLWFL